MLASSLLPLGCSDAIPGTRVVDESEAKLVPTPKSMRITSSFGGVHHNMEIVGGVWFQSYANRLLMLDSQSGTMLTDLELAPRGTTGVLVDFLVMGNTILAVLNDDQVVAIDITIVRTPIITARWTRAELGISPREISLVQGEAFVSGVGGAVRLDDAKPVGTIVDEVDDKGEPIVPVAPTPMLAGKTVGCIVDAVAGPVACVGRRIVRLSDGTYVGAASVLLPLPSSLGGGYAFALQAPEGAQVGLMGGDFRERSTSALPGEVHRIRVFDGRLFAVNDFEIATWKIEAASADGSVASATLASTPASTAALNAPNTITSSDAANAAPPQKFALGALLSVPVKGAQDVAMVKRNRYAVAGSFGRSLYRYLPEGDQPGDTFYWAQRQPGRLDVCVSDRRRVLAASREGSWMYLIGDKGELTERAIASPDRPDFKVGASWGEATCNEALDEVSFQYDDRAITLKPSRGGLISTLALADGRIWMGHDGGIDVVGFDPLKREVIVEDSIVLDGPILAIYSNRVGGGVTYVAHLDGFGVIRPVNIDAPPTITAGCVNGEPKAVVVVPVTATPAKSGKNAK